MDALYATIVIGIILIAIAGCALFLIYDWRKHSLAKIAEERALIAQRQQAISQREQPQREYEEERARTMQVRSERRARRAAQRLLLKGHKENISSDSSNNGP